MLLLRSIRAFGPAKGKLCSAFALIAVCLTPPSLCRAVLRVTAHGLWRTTPLQAAPPAHLPGWTCCRAAARSAPAEKENRMAELGPDSFSAKVARQPGALPGWLLSYILGQR